MIFNIKETRDAKTLEGHGAEYFATAEAMGHGDRLTTSILEKALTLGAGVYNFSLDRGNYTGDDLPNKYYAYGMASVYRSTTTKGTTVILWGGQYDLPIAVNMHDGTNWFGWDTLFTSAGGTIDGNVTFATEEALTRYLRLKNSKRQITHQIGEDGSYRLNDNTNGGNSIISSTPTGTNTFNGTASKNVLSVNGTAHMSTLGGFMFSRNSGTVCTPKYEGNGVILGYLGFGAVDSPIMYTADGKYSRSLLHTGNSAKTVISSTAPSDTTALWIDTSA